MPDAGWIDDEDLADLAPVSGRLGEQVAFDVVDDDAVGPGEKLTDGQQPFAPAGWRNDQDITKLPARGGRPDPKHMLEVGHSQEQVRSVRYARFEQAGEFME